MNYRRIEAVDNKAKSRYFQINDDNVMFADSSVGMIGDSVFDGKENEIGTIVDIHPSEEKIFLRQKDGKVIPFASTSIKSKGMTGDSF